MKVVLLEDKELVKRALAGDSASYEALFERHRSSVLGILQSRCGDEALSEDILQEAFIKAYLNLEKYNPKYSFGGWLMTIAQNLFIDYTRKIENQPKQGEVELRSISSGPNPEEHFMVAEDNRRLNEALESLTPAYRTIIEMRFWRDLSYEQIADELNLPIGTVKTQIFRARRAFIEKLG